MDNVRDEMIQTGKEAISQRIDSLREELLRLSHDIHDHPEIGFQEFLAVEYISEVLKSRGFQVEEGYCGVPTSFKAVKKG